MVLTVGMLVASALLAPRPARASLDLPAPDRALLLELGVFRTGPVAIAQEVIDPYFDLLLEMVREDPPYMFGEDERFYEKIMELGAANCTQSMDAHFPEDIIFIDRSFAGHFGNLTTLKAQGPWREIADKYTRD